MDGRMLPKEPGDPRRLGPYELLGRLGQGGMGVVFLGRERRGGHLAAVKALRPELAGDPSFAGRFRREVDAARRVDSPNVARVLDADPAAERPWLATEYVDGSTLADVVAAGGPLAGGRLEAFATGVARALAAIHAAGVVHRDLKPSNVLLDQAGAAPDPAATRPLGPARPTPDPAAMAATRPLGPAPGAALAGVKVIDFGVAWAVDATRTRSGPRFGTPSWMAPEQLRDRPAGPPVDLFAWGMLVAFAATGRHPFGGGPPEAVAYRILHHEPDLAGVPEPVRRLVRDALSRDPAARPPAAAVAAALAAASSPTLPLPAADPTWFLPAAAGVVGATTAGPTRRRRRRRVGPLLVAAALLAGLATTPHVVLAAVAGPDDPSRGHRHATKVCGEERDPDDQLEAERERDEEAAEKAEEAEGEARAKANEAEGMDDGQPPPTTPSPAPVPVPDPAGEVLGS